MTQARRKSPTSSVKPKPPIPPPERYSLGKIAIHKTLACPHCGKLLSFPREVLEELLNND
jgi:hypothetical protein